MGIKLDTEHVMVMGIFERVTEVHVIDCLIDDENVYFIIKQGKMGMAIGKNGSKIKNVSKILGKKIRIFEYSENLEGMLKNMIPTIKTMEMNDNIVTLSVPIDDKPSVIGKNGRNIKIVREFLKRHFDIKNLRLK